MTYVHHFVSGLWAFAVKQAWAALFGGLMLAALVLTAYVPLPWLARYDWLFLAAIAIQAFMLLAKLERPYEVITIVTFHLTGLAMEIFKTAPAIASWSYPGPAFFKVAAVPLFSGFMYAAVGSYMARAWRVFRLTFSHYPYRPATALLALAIYTNFFTHHYTYDVRYILFALILLIYGRVWVSYTINTVTRRMPLVVAFALIAFFIWVAENVGTYVKAWLYPGQLLAWHPVSLSKLGSWALLMVISYILVDLLQYARRRYHLGLEAPPMPTPASLAYTGRKTRG
ncbi:MAG TPA: DUF817 domain-containing protein [Candidatus Saccharimonas sp.]|nr:DUF817 domain-containing protein [Candidatus Saccharimonas sp.]